MLILSCILLKLLKCDYKVFFKYLDKNIDFFVGKRKSFI